MQSSDDEGMILYAKMLKQKELEKSIADASAAGATQHAIGELPHRGDVLEIRGLKFKVQSVDYKREEIRLALVKPAK